MVCRWTIQHPRVFYGLPGLAEKRKAILAAQLAKVATHLGALQATFESGAASGNTKISASLNKRMATQRRIGEQAYRRYCAWNTIVRNRSRKRLAEGHGCASTGTDQCILRRHPFMTITARQTQTLQRRTQLAGCSRLQARLGRGQLGRPAP